jgi:hypothetical protein
MIEADWTRSPEASPGFNRKFSNLRKENRSMDRKDCWRQAPTPATVSLRKEVIQPQVLLRLPCYDFTPIMNHTLGRCPLAVGMQTSSTIHFRDVTGGVYKARERIHAIVLIRHY